MISGLVTLERLIAPEKADSPTPYATAGLPLIIILIALALTLSRSAWLGSLAGVCWIMAFGRTGRGIRKSPLIVLTAAVATLILIPGVRERSANLLSLKEGSNAARMEGWKAGLKVWRSHPYIGSGTDTFFQAFRSFRSEAYITNAGIATTQADAHNDLIQFAATQGTFGLLAYLLIIAIALRCLTMHSAKTSALGLSAALIALLIQNQFNFSSITTSTWAAITAGLLFSLGEQAPPEDFAIRSAVGRPIGFGLLGICAVAIWWVLVPLRADAAFKAGLVYAAQDQQLKALAYEKEAVRLCPHVESYVTELANTYRTLGHLASPGAQKETYFDQAWAWAQRAALDHPHNPDSWNNRGVAAMWLVQLANRNMYNDAKESFDRAVQLDPVFVDAWANLAKWQHLTGHIDEEKRLWRKVLELDPNHPMAHQVLEGKL